MDFNHRNKIFPPDLGLGGRNNSAVDLGLVSVLCLDERVSGVSLRKISEYCDRLLKVDEIEDWSGAVNGLQVENRIGVSHVVAAVDGSLATVRKAVSLGADLMIVHHGLFWSSKQPWVGRNYELMELLVQSGLALYSSHLPLDVHPRFGNNVLLAKALGLKTLEPFFFDRGRNLGVKAKTRWSVKALVERMTTTLGHPPVVLSGGGDQCRAVGIVTGGAGAELKIAAAEGVDTFITGEGPHWTHALAEELGINVIYGGHYATETFGVRALSEHLAKRFSLKCSFVDHPTGL